ncbi:MAG TPA: enoyl-ACP reductase [Tepidiformaceae bacterium]|nr:enoyl-ACP reductase [Tepidiformaceae bacterium]
MGKLEGKTALIFGVANDHSIAWGIAQAFHREGAKLAFSYAMPSLEKRVRPLAESVGSDFIELCDVTDDAQLDAVFAKAKERLGTIDILVHAIAFANRDDLMGRFVDTSREGFLLAHNVSVYSLVALANRTQELMPNGGSILTLTYYGSQKVAPRYNVMGVAKAALEATTRYLAWDLGPQNIRVNAISAGPIRTLAASGISGFRDYLKQFATIAPLHRNVTIEQVGEAAAFLASDSASGITGDILYVDNGFNIMGLANEERE